MLKLARLAASGAAMLLAAQGPSIAGPVGVDVDGLGWTQSRQDPALILVARNKRPRTEGVTRVLYARGEFRRVGPKRWVESVRKMQYQFREVGDDGRMITLFDRSRNIFVYLSLRREMILWAPDGEEPRDLYPITGVIKDTPVDEDEFEPEPPKILRYVCDEGVPLVVRIENRGERSRAFVSVDGSQDMRLNQIPSGSGIKFSDGLYTILIKGRNAVVEYDNNTDICAGR